MPETKSQPGNAPAEKGKSFAGRDRVSWVMVLCACVLQVVLGTVLARTNLPLCDEGFYGVPAQVLNTTGALRNPVMESAGIKYLQGIDQTFYWMVPLGMVLQAAAFKVFGFGLLIQRGLSVVCGVGAVLMWYLALRRLIADRTAALASILLSADFVFLSLSSRGRSDMISLFFAMAGLAAYMHWRERNLTLGLAVANIACGLSGMVHPNGGIAAVASLLVLVLYLDRRRLRWSHLAVVAGCYGVLGLCWGWYIAKAPNLFVAQFLGNVAGRFEGPMTLTRIFKGELTRYMSAYGLLNVHGIKLVRILLPVSYLSAIVFCAVSKGLRRRSAVLLMMFVLVSLSLVFLEGAKQGWYLVHLSPLFCAFLAIAMTRLWSSGNIMARTIAGTQAVIVVLGVMSLMYTASSRNLQLLYRPTVAFLNAHVEPNEMVFARSEFYFGMRCKTCLRDDTNLGELSGRRAEYIVIDTDYIDQLMKLRATSPATYHDIEERLSTEYKEVFHNSNYQVLRRTAAGH